MPTPRSKSSYRKNIFSQKKILSYEQAEWDGQLGEGGQGEGDEDVDEEGDQLPGGGVQDEGRTSPLMKPGGEPFRPGVGLDLQDPRGPSPPPQAPLPEADPPLPPSPSLEAGEARHQREDRTVTMPDGSRLQISRRALTLFFKLNAPYFGSKEV